ncbi:SMP-30/gluconolactonase/LRE family protein [Actinomadura sp. ATCC 31491]|uniref:SMP-30/gluconolactonase/LRE family protein n=1 Tax=Actinomadura luzonensis TaxID=2805427 RepID=A0ABT0FPH9_9ACTN|nr:SMP-30/gluconolactonase/LRE family protein [Actinomadura luzonensis]MCK2214191.1 SMP-30/gluconolactonase/LRE family protein [Actinomadura luzonensis]
MTDTIPTQFEVLDDRAAGIGGDYRTEVLHTGTRWGEGPVYFPAGRFLVWSDIPNDRMLRWDEMTGAVGPFRQPAGYVNGNTLDRQGRLISCEQGGRRVTRTEPDGSITVIADRWQGRRLNSPNDAVVHSDGSVWFTDPPYGITSNYEGVAAEQEIDGCHVYRADPVTGEVRIVADDFERPNGLAFSLDESLLYVADTRRRHLRVFEVGEDGTLAGGKVFAEGGEKDGFDGLRLDDTGRVWAVADKAVHCYDPDGTLIGRLKLPEHAANLVFGGLKRNRMFIAAASSLYSLMCNVTGAAPVWARR